MPVAHHLAHLASAFFVSPFDEALAVSVDGFGDFASAAWGMGRGSELTLDGQVGFPHSLGVLYQAFTQYLGFPHYGDEYKVMGLAPYGDPTWVDAIRRVVRDHPRGFELDLRYFCHHRERIAYDWDDGAPTFAALYSPELERLLGTARHADEPLEQRHKDIAASLQLVFEERYLGLLSRLAEHTRASRVTIAGGCAQNSVANGKITSATPLCEVYVAAAGHDAGGALGAALYVANRLGCRRGPPLRHAQLGPAFDGHAIDAVVRAHADALTEQQIRVDTLDAASADERVVDVLVAGGVVGWFQGRMEWGPRALGNRSILADPRRGDMKEILNRTVKRRESFRPFAPSVLREHVAEWFGHDAEVPFMEMVLPVRGDKRARIPAVTHVDGTARPQTVSVEDNPRYHRLISAFHRRTGVPMVLNTSFNENEPIVCRPEQALDCFVRTRMDLLVLGDTVLTRGGEGAAAAADGVTEAHLTPG